MGLRTTRRPRYRSASAEGSRSTCLPPGRSPSTTPPSERLWVNDPRETTMKVISAISFLALILTLSFPAAAQSPEANDSLQNDVSPPVGALVLRAAAVRPQKLRQAPEMLRPKLEQLA